MDLYTAAVAVVLGVVALLIGLRATTLADRRFGARMEQELEIARLKSNWYNQMQLQKSKKKSKKSRKNREDDEDQDDEDGDELDDAIEGLRPFAPFLKGMAQAKGLPIDVDRLLEHDELEKEKVAAWIEMQMRKPGGQNVFETNMAGPL